MKQLRQFYSELSKKSFLRLAISFLLITDICVLGYIYIKFNNYSFFERVMEMSLAINGLSVESMGPEFVTALHSLFYRSLVFSISLAGLYHLINYYYWTKGKAFARLYIKILVTAGGPLIFLMGVSMIFSGSFFGLVIAILGLLVTSLLIGLKYHESD